MILMAYSIQPSHLHELRSLYRTITLNEERGTMSELFKKAKEELLADNDGVLRVNFSRFAYLASVHLKENRVAHALQAATVPFQFFTHNKAHTLLQTVIFGETGKEWTPEQLREALFWRNIVRQGGPLDRQYDKEFVKSLKECEEKEQAEKAKPAEGRLEAAKKYAESWFAPSYYDRPQGERTFIQLTENLSFSFEPYSAGPIGRYVMLKESGTLGIVQLKGSGHVLELPFDKAAKDPIIAADLEKIGNFLNEHLQAQTSLIIQKLKENGFVNQVSIGCLLGLQRQCDAAFPK